MLHTSMQQERDRQEPISTDPSTFSPKSWGKSPALQFAGSTSLRQKG